jgi:hypothetical protein
MYANDSIGDCTCASAAHMIQLWTSQSGVMQNPALNDVMSMYERFGYTPSNPESDGGAAMLDVLNSWRQLGLGVAPNPVHKIGAFVKIDHEDVEHVKAAIDYFGGVYCGAGMPITAQTNGPTNPWAGPLPGDRLTPSERPNSWGGHCLGVGAYDRSGVTFLTWGARQVADWNWWNTYVDEAYVMISQDWISEDGTAPVGLPVAELNQFLSQLAA